MKHLLSFIFTLCVAFSQTTNAQNWVNTNGPKRINEVRDLTIGKSGSTQKLYAADEIHVRVSSNGGANWDSTSQLISSPVVIECKPSSPDEAIVAKNGNAYYTTNGGSNWGNPTTTSDLVPLRVSISTANSDIAYLGTDTIQRGSTWTTSLWKTDDGGASWAAQNYFRDSAHTNVRDIAYHPYSLSKVWVCGTAGSPGDMTVDYGLELETETIKPYGVWYTSDGGTNWTRRVSGMSTTEAKNVTSMVLSVPNGTSDTLLFASVRTTTNGDAKFFKSTNFGSNWTEVTNVFPSGTKDVRVMKMKPGSVDTIIAATNFGFLYSSTRGSGWSQRITGLTELDVRQVVFDKNDPLTVYAATAGGVFKSTDLGNNWSQQTVNTSVVNTFSVAGMSNILHTSSKVAAVINKSTNAGAAWDLGAVIGQRRFAGYHISINANYSGYAYTGGDSTSSSDNVDGVIYTTTNSGSVWIQAFNRSATNDDHLRFYQVIADPKKTSSRVYGVGKVSTSSTNPNFFYSTNKGVTWGKTLGAVIRSGGGADTSLCLAIDSSGNQTNSQTMYAGLASGYGVYRSTDGGATWASRGLSGKTVRAIALKQSSAQVLYAGADEGFFKSTDGGANWGNALRSDIVPRVLFHPSYTASTSHLWVIADGGNKIFKTVDGGTNWDSINTSSLPKPLNDVRSDPANDSLIYVATASGIYKINPVPETTQGLAYSGSRNQHPVISWTANSESDLAGYKLYKSECGGFQYQLLHIIGPDSSSYQDNTTVIGDGSGNTRYYIIAYDNQNNEATQSSVLNVPCTWNPEKAVFDPGTTEELPTEFELSANYPNPFNPITTIKYALPEDVHVKLTVVDIVGREVAVLVNERQTAGYKSVEFDASKLSSGMYLYKLVAGTFADVKKMVVAK